VASGKLNRKGKVRGKGREKRKKKKELVKISPRDKVLITALQKLIAVIGEGLKRSQSTICTFWTMLITVCFPT